MDNDRDIFDITKYRFPNKTGYVIDEWHDILAFAS